MAAKEVLSRRFQSLRAWLERHGAILPLTEPLYLNSHEMGVRLCAAAEEDSLVARIPRSCLVTSTQARREIPLELCIENHEAVPAEHWPLILWVLEQRKQLNLCVTQSRAEADRDDGDVHFGAFLGLLPRLPDLLHVPLLWHPEQLGLLRGSHLLEKVLRDRQLLIELFLVAKRQNSAFLRLAGDFRTFVWAYLVVNSRNFECCVDGDQTAALVPFIDMLNHRRPRQTSWRYNSEAEGFELRAECWHSPGAELLDSYGAKPNHELLLNFGFCVDVNVDSIGGGLDEVQLVLSVPATDDLFWRGQGHGGSGEDEVVVASSEAVEDLLGDENFVKRDLLCDFLTVDVTKFEVVDGDDCGKPDTAREGSTRRFVKINIAEQDNAAFFHLLSLCRALAADPDEIKAWASRGRTAFSLTVQDSTLKLERKAWARIRQLCQDQLARYELDEDSCTSDSADESYETNVRNARSLIESERRILYWLRHMADALLADEQEESAGRDTPASYGESILTRFRTRSWQLLLDREETAKK